MKRGLKYKIMTPLFGSLFTAFVVGAVTKIINQESDAGSIASSMIISGLVSLLVIGFITNLIIAKIVKPLADTAAIMNQSLGFMENISVAMIEIENSTKEIDNITNIVNDLRFQAHLLALNATVEAVKAGEAGRGFTVVAAEIKNLAQKTADASKTIQGLVAQNAVPAKKALQLVNESSGFLSTVMKTINELN